MFELVFFLLWQNFAVMQVQIFINDIHKGILGYDVIKKQTNEPWHALNNLPMTWQGGWEMLYIIYVNFQKVVKFGIRIFMA